MGKVIQFPGAQVPPKDGKYYYRGGSVFHTDPDCPELQKTGPKIELDQAAIDSMRKMGVTLGPCRRCRR